MKRKIISSLAMMLILTAATVVYAAVAGRNSHNISIEDEYGTIIPMADIISVEVFNPGTRTRSTIYMESAATNAITQPITSSSTNTTLANSQLWWWGNNAYDVKVTLTGGVTVIKEGLDSSDGGVRIDHVIVSNDRTVIALTAQPVAVQEDGTVATDTDTEVNVMIVEGETFEYVNINTQTILVPNIVATGLDIARDLTATDGTEWTQGILASSKAAFTVGTSKAFFFRVKFTLTDVTGTADCAIGFRKAEAYQPLIDDYDEMAALNVISGNVTIETILNGGATTATDTTNDWADLATHTLQVNVSAAGVVTYLIDGVAPLVVAAFTFDDTEVVLPFFYMIHDTDLAESTILLTWEVGLQ